MLTCICSHLIALTTKVNVIIAKLNKIISLLEDVSIWETGIAYCVGDVVKRKNITYIAILDHTSAVKNAPPNTTYWEISE